MLYENIATYNVKRPWIWVTKKTITPVQPLSTYTGGDIANERAYYVDVKPGAFELTDSSLVSSPSATKARIGMELLEDYDQVKGTYRVLLDNKYTISIPNPPWDARSDYTEFTLIIVVATVQGGEWDPQYHPKGNFVVDIDVSTIFDAVVGKISSMYLAGNQMVAIWKGLGLFKGYGTVRVGVHWDWVWDSSWSQTIEYLATITTHIATTANQLSFALINDSSDVDSLDGDYSIVESPAYHDLHGAGVKSSP